MRLYARLNKDGLDEETAERCVNVREQENIVSFVLTQIYVSTYMYLPASLMLLYGRLADLKREAYLGTLIVPYKRWIFLHSVLFYVVCTFQKSNVCTIRLLSDLMASIHILCYFKPKCRNSIFGQITWDVGGRP